ncbi:MAG: hypothetical protein ACRELZ_25055, partial [Candidatus Rokuibacteriota bacterium]
SRGWPCSDACWASVAWCDGRSMGHCPFELLDDPGDVLDDVRDRVSLDLPRPISATRRRGLRRALHRHDRDTWGGA